MDEHSTQGTATTEPGTAPTDLPRRDFLGLATAALGGLVTLTLAIPGVAYLLSPLRRTDREGAFHALTRLEQLKVGVPQSFAIVDAHQDSWVKYPPEPIGSVWLVRRPAGSDPAVIAFQSECPHLGCAVNLKPDGSGFRCPCHTSSFTLDGAPTNQVPPRPMDRLEVQLAAGDDPEVRVRFQRFRTATEEKIPLV
jgi:quinol---cytochrome c reductase iron-sulfur subunit, bacillus type